MLYHRCYHSLWVAFTLLVSCVSGFSFVAPKYQCVPVRHLSVKSQKDSRLSDSNEKDEKSFAGSVGKSLRAAKTGKKAASLRSSHTSDDMKTTTSTTSRWDPELLTREWEKQKLQLLEQQAMTEPSCTTTQPQQHHRENSEQQKETTAGKEVRNQLETSSPIETAKSTEQTNTESEEVRVAQQVKDELKSFESTWDFEPLHVVEEISENATAIHKAPTETQASENAGDDAIDDVVTNTTHIDKQLKKQLHVEETTAGENETAIPKTPADTTASENAGDTDEDGITNTTLIDKQLTKQTPVDPFSRTITNNTATQAAEMANEKQETKVHVNETESSETVSDIARLAIERAKEKLLPENATYDRQGNGTVAQTQTKQKLLKAKEWLDAHEKNQEAQAGIDVDVKETPKTSVAQEGKAADAKKLTTDPHVELDPAQKELEKERALVRGIIDKAKKKAIKDLARKLKEESISDPLEKVKYRLEEQEKERCLEEAERIEHQQEVSFRLKPLTDLATGVEFPPKLGPGRYLMGVGVRRRLLFHKVYSVAMYSGEEVKMALSSISLKREKRHAMSTLRSIAKMTPTTFLLEMVSRKSAKALSNAVSKGVAKRYTGHADFVEELRVLIFDGIMTMGGYAHKGATLEFDCTDNGLTVTIDGQTSGTVHDSRLSEAFCDMYLDDQTSSRQLRQSCLENCCPP